MGRKSKFNEATINIVCIAHENGAPMNLCAKFAGIDRKTLYNWIKKGENSKRGKYREFYIRWEKSDAKYQLKHLQNINAHSENDWRASKYLLEVNNPDAFVIEKRLQTNNNTKIINEGLDYFKDKKEYDKEFAVEDFITDD